MTAAAVSSLLKVLLRGIHFLDIFCSDMLHKHAFNVQEAALVQTFFAMCKCYVEIWPKSLSLNKGRETAAVVKALYKT